MVSRNFSEALKFGRPGERQVAEELIRDGWVVLPLGDLPALGGRGPHAYGQGDPTVPDLQATKHGRSIAVEVKTKDAATLRRITNQLEHGIDRADFDGYLRYEREVMPTFLVVLERHPVPEILVARITEIRPRDGAFADGTPMKFWPRDDQMAIGLSAVLMRLNRYVTQSNNSQARKQAPEPEGGLW